MRMAYSVIGEFRTSAVTKRINEQRQTPGAPVWQGRFYESIIRNERMLDARRQTIMMNPARWQFDRENVSI